MRWYYGGTHVQEDKAVVTMPHSMLCERKTAETRRRNAMANPAKFVRDVRQEANKVSWPSRKEVVVSTITVVVMVIFASLFFLLVDGIISTLVELILGLGA